MMMMMNSYW